MTGPSCISRPFLVLLLPSESKRRLFGRRQKLVSSAEMPANSQRGLPSWPHSDSRRSFLIAAEHLNVSSGGRLSDLRSTLRAWSCHHSSQTARQIFRLSAEPAPIVT